MRLDVVFDSVCPWCYIGKRRLFLALKTRPHTRLELRWRPFLLNPDVPPEGMERAYYLERKFGSPYRISRIQRAAALAGEEVGINFNFDSILRTPNTVNSHRLVQWAMNDLRQDELVERIFAAFFTEGRNIGDIEVLADIAAETGFQRSEALSFLNGSEGAPAVEADNLRVRRWGISGVPCFVFEQRYAVAGAQDVDMLARLIDIVKETELESVSLV